MSAWNLRSRNGAVVTSAFLLAAGLTSLNCGFSSSEDTGAAGTSGQGQAGTSGAAGDSASGEAGTTGGGAGVTGAAGTSVSTTGNAGTTGGGAGVTGAAGTSVSTTGAAGTAAPTSEFKNYELSGSFPTAQIAMPTKAGGKLEYTKVVIHNQFLAESCSIADYNRDGTPDVSSGRIWYQGPDFKTTHAFRSGHGVLPSKGDGPEIDTGVSDDWSDFPWDVDNDGWADIINIAQCDVDEISKTNPKVGIVQPHATAYWYKNPGPGLAGDPMWVKNLMHQDVRLEQHTLVDMNKDGFPEIVGACKGCIPATTKGYYQANRANPAGGWTFVSVTVPYTFPFGGLGWMHGSGAGDVNGDGFPDLLERGGAWIQQPGQKWNSTVCTGKDTPAGCGWIKEKTPLLQTGFYDGLQDNAGNKGASHMYAVDMDMDGKSDVVAADWAHGQRLFWYKQMDGYAFKKYQFMGTENEKAAWSGVGFTEPHALQVVDMDGDGRPDVITGKMRYAHPRGYGDPDLEATPVLYVFKNVGTPDARPGAGGSPITLQPVLVDPIGTPGMIGTPEGGVGVGRQLAVGHINTDGIPDICIASKVGLAVFLGK
jgi:hypothetical protein